MSMIGNPIISTDFPKDTFSGTGSATAFTMSIAPASVNAVIVIVSGVTQDPATYSISGTTLTFSAAPPSGTNNISVRHLGVAGIPNTPSAASVVTSSIAANAVTPAKMANGGAEFGMRNRIINGDFRIDQRNAGASVTPTASGYTLDRWNYVLSQASKGSIQQNAGSVAVVGATGFTNYLGFTSASAYSITTSDYFFLAQPIEGFNVADLAYGTASAKTVTLSFWVYSSLTGTFGGSLRNNGATKSYPFTYTVSSANTWTQASITISGDTATALGSTTNGTGLQVCFGLGVGSTSSATAGSWQSGNYYSATGATSVVGTSGATFYITGVQLEVGSTATNFDYRSYGQELALCQRYFYSITGAPYQPLGGGAAAGGSNIYDGYGALFPSVMRTSPTLSYSALSDFQLLDGVGANITPTSVAANAGPNGYQLLVAVASGLTTGKMYFLRMVNTSTGKLNFSAEL